MSTFRIPSSGLVRPLMWLFGASSGHIDIGHDRVRVRLGVLFHADVDRSAIRSATANDHHPISRGAHGWRGRWLVNGSGRDLVDLAIEPVGRGRVIGWPVRLRTLTVNVDRRDALIAELSSPV